MVELSDARSIYILSNVMISTNVSINVEYSFSIA